MYGWVDGWTERPAGLSIPPAVAGPPTHVAHPPLGVGHPTQVTNSPKPAQARKAHRQDSCGSLNNSKHEVPTPPQFPRSALIVQGYPKAKGQHGCPKHDLSLRGQACRARFCQQAVEAAVAQDLESFVTQDSGYIRLPLPWQHSDVIKGFCHKKVAAFARLLQHKAVATLGCPWQGTMAAMKYSHILQGSCHTMSAFGCRLIFATQGNGRNGRPSTVVVTRQRPHWNVIDKAMAAFGLH